MIDVSWSILSRVEGYKKENTKPDLYLQKFFVVVSFDVLVATEERLLMVLVLFPNYQQRSRFPVVLDWILLDVLH